MPINTLQYSTNFQRSLDKAAVVGSTTGWMEANAGQVLYNGGAEVKIPKMSVNGLGDYDRDDGYVQGSVTLDYETRKMTQDRGRLFTLDAKDVNETNFVATAASVMGIFQDEHVIPEIDAYRISSLATQAIDAKIAGMVEYGYTPSENTSTLRKIKEGIKAVRANGYTGPLVIQATNDVVMELELELAGKITVVDFSRGGIVTKVPAVDGVPIIETPSNRMYSAITLYDGKTAGQEAGGYVKGETAKDVNFIITARRTPLAISKQDLVRIFDPATYQKKNAWSVDYRRYHDIWVLDNKLNSIYVSIKDVEG